MFSDNVYHEYQFKRPVELAMRVLDELESSWYGLTQAAQTELESILVAFRVELYQARDDMARGRALTKLLYALEAAAATPASIRARLTASHQPTMRDGGERWDSAAARAFVVRIDGLIGAAPELAPSTGPASSAEEFPEAVAVVERVLEQLNQRWSELALRTQDQAKLWLQAYERALRSADNDWLRLEATHEFLRHLKDEAEIWEKVHTAFRGPARPGPQPPFPVGAQVMTADDAAGVRALIDSNPAMAVAKTPQTIDGDHGPREMPAPPETEAETLPETAAESQPAAATVVDFHTDVRFPGQVSTFDRAIPLQVRLTMDKAEGTVVDAEVSIEFITPEPQPVLVVCNAEGFVDETGDLTRTIMVYQDRDSQTAIFLLTPDPEAGPGVRRISLDFIHRERPAGSASFQVDVRDRPPIDQTPVEPEPALVDRAEDGTILARVGGTLLLASPDAAKPDFVLRITLSADRRRLSYSLHSPTGRLGMVHQRMGSVTLQSDPRTFLDNTLLRLSQMARASRSKLTDTQFAAHKARLQEIGWELYEQLFTPQLRQAYRSLRQLRAQEPNLSLLIVSDEPWIPWEMVLPHEADLPAEDFLCAQFRMTRWLDGSGLPEGLDLSQAQVVVPQSNLASVKMEQDFFSQQLPPTVGFSGKWLDTATQVKDALRQGSSHWFHFACHGDFDYARPDESALQLKADSLTPSQIVGPMRTGVAASRPLVFLNACHTAEAGFSLTRMGGWAERFVRAGASAFIGSLWEVNDTLAAEFAVKFYTELLAGQTLGDAFHAARAHIRARDDANPTWLAYTLYADPNGRVKPVNGDR